MNNGLRFSFWQRALGMAGVALGFYLIIFVALAKVDISWLVPTQKIANHLLYVWPRLPFFAVDKESTDNGKEQEIYYTVPTRQFTKEELAKIPQETNQVVAPATPAQKHQ